MNGLIVFLLVLYALQLTVVTNLNRNECFDSTKDYLMWMFPFVAPVIWFFGEVTECFRK